MNPQEQLDVPTGDYQLERERILLALEELDDRYARAVLVLLLLSDPAPQ